MKKFFTSLFLIRFNKNKFDAQEIHLPGKLIKAPDSKVKNILDFAKSYHVMETEETHMIEINLN